MSHASPSLYPPLSAAAGDIGGRVVIFYSPSGVCDFQWCGGRNGQRKTIVTFL